MDITDSPQSEKSPVDNQEFTVFVFNMLQYYDKWFEEKVQTKPH